MEARLPHDQQATTGRGMFIVEQLADDWGVEPPTTGGKCVWSRFAAPQAEGVHNACGNPPVRTPPPVEVSGLLSSLRHDRPVR